MASVFKVAAYIYPHSDILDFSGPLEIYNCAPPPNNPHRFETTTFAHHNPVQAATKSTTYVPSASFAEVERDLESYDILVIPGAWPEAIVKLLDLDEGKQLLALIRRFAQLKPRAETGARVLQSVCSGSLILAAAGVLAGRKVTTHHLCFGELKEMADKAAGGDAGMEILKKKRWVDGGKTEAGVRIINAGGVTSGIDASLFVVEELAGKAYSDFTADIVEFERRGQNDGWDA
ncbi:class I glutamine amidotransferase-like protein [Corynespora cassiicola Philippines]|uniref:Class I glutamine amidotransferase-like protein n=1 Tax=Corynespora cassiicola Philippines TaxID=1448308 RepID=A0A2T2P447_CORCC|nr:class I glutamine amidotransferase-like protein [Corynespora cassiicola Philippines]